MPQVFKAQVNKFEKGLWSYHIMVPEQIYNYYEELKIKRIMCQIDEYEPFHAGFMPDGNGQWFIKLNKDKMKRFELNVLQEIEVKLEEDTSKYGMEIPEEFEAVLESDFEGASFFEKLTPGKRRSLIYMISTIKSSDIKITKTLIILDHLKANNGKLDYKLLNEAFKLK